MSVTTPHPEYADNVSLWVKCRDVIDGEEAVKAAGVRYLPRLSGQDDADYQAYKERASFYGATARTLDGLVGEVLRRPPDVRVPEAMKELIVSLGPNGEPLGQLIKTTLEEVCGLGRVGLYVDTSSEGENTPPYVALYYAENIVNWREEVIGGRSRLTLVVLKEQRPTPKPEDEFDNTTEDMYRVLRLTRSIPREDGGVEELESPEYVVEIWTRKEQPEGGKEGTPEGQYELTRVIRPRLQGGQALDYIPFVIVSATRQGGIVEKSPLLPLVNVNLSHYRTSADLEHGLHFTALPTAWVAGNFTTPAGALRIGSAVAWVSDDPNAKAGFLEFTGTGLGALRTALDSKERMMAVLGSRMLEEQRRAVESADALELRGRGEKSVLANIAGSVSVAFSVVLRWVAVWTRQASDMDSASGIRVELNQDFDVRGVPPQLLQTLMAMYQSSVISWDTLVYNMQRGELLPDGRTPEEEASLIRLGGPVALPRGDEDIDEDEDDLREEAEAEQGPRRPHQE